MTEGALASGQRLPKLVERAGLGILGAVGAAGALTLLALRALGGLTQRPVPLSATLHQIHTQGVRALGLAAVGAASAGMVLSLQFGTGLGRFGAASLLPALTTLGLYRELVPVLTSLIIGSRFGAGIAAELGSMAVTEQIDAIRVLGADPIHELATPRIVAATVVLPLICLMSDVVATGGAMAVANLQHGIGVRYFIHSSAEIIEAQDVLSGIGKAAVFGLVIGLLACWHGARARGGTEGVGRATTRTVVQGALAVIVLDFFLSRGIDALTGRG